MAMARNAAVNTRVMLGARRGPRVGAAGIAEVAGVGTSDSEVMRRSISRGLPARDKCCMLRADPARRRTPVPDLLETLRDALAQRYAVERELGRGGMATVFLAEDRKHGRPVAIKVLHSELAAALGAERFLREIEIAARLQ